MLRGVLLWSSENEFLARRLPRYRFVKRAVRRFMPGEDLADALRESSVLSKTNRGTLLTLLGENVNEESESTEVVQSYLDALAAVGDRSLDVEISVKLTQLGLDLDEAVAESNLRALVEASGKLDRMVWLDMESSVYVDRTLDLYRTVRADHANVGVCLQSYLRRTPEDLETLMPLGSAVRLVKGAYAEPPDIAFPKKRHVDEAFFDLACRMIDALPSVRTAFGTHDAALMRRIQAVGEERGVDRGRVEFQMLYGIGVRDQERLAADGYRVRVLISYGSAWFPWYMRRLAERPANLTFVLRKMFAS
ncbi:MAG: proline dehydrogenase family protein [Gemmatimonadetes bacterium]|nr:proline dehydrogenase family protein [Gemmatimonadota bacterium]